VRELKITLVVEIDRIGILMIHLDVTPYQNHRLEAKRTDASLPMVESCHHLPRKFLAPFTLIRGNQQFAPVDDLKRLDECESAEFFLKPVKCCDEFFSFCHVIIPLVDQVDAHSRLEMNALLNLTPDIRRLCNHKSEVPPADAERFA